MTDSVVLCLKDYRIHHAWTEISNAQARYPYESGVHMDSFLETLNRKYAPMAFTVGDVLNAGYVEIDGKLEMKVP